MTGTNQSIFGRYMATRFTEPPAYAGGPTTSSRRPTGLDDMRPTRRSLGATHGAQPVDGQRAAVRGEQRHASTLPDAVLLAERPRREDVQLLPPGHMPMNVTGGFLIYDAGTQTKALFLNNTYQVADDLTLVRGSHQFGFGGNVLLLARATYTSTSRAAGNWIFDGSATGLGLGGSAARPRHQRRARRPEPGDRPQLVPGAVCAGHLARCRTG